MEQVERDQKLADLVAHMTPQQMAERILAIEEQRDTLQRENDNYLFGSTEQRNAMRQAAGNDEPEDDVPSKDPALDPQLDEDPDDVDDDDIPDDPDEDDEQP